MFKNIIKKFAAFGLVAVLCVPCCFAFAQMQEEPNDEKSYSQEDLPGLIEKASREKNYFVLDMLRSRIKAELSGSVPKALTEYMDEELIKMFRELSAEEIAKTALTEVESRGDAFLLALEQIPQILEAGDVNENSPVMYFLDAFLSDVYGECYSK